MADTQTLHFRVGADMGIILSNIAHEHLIYENDFDKALSVFTDSFGEQCPEDLLMQLLTGDMITLVDEDRQEFVVVPRAEHPHLDSLYPKIDIIAYAQRVQQDLDDRCAELKQGLNNLVRKFDGNHYMNFTFSAEAMMLYIYGNDEDLIAEIHEDYELNEWQLLIKLAYEFIKTSFAKAEVIRKFATHLGLDVELDTFRVGEIATALQKIAVLDFDAMNYDEGLQDYMEASKEIAETIETGIAPVDIMDNYSAGWLSPEGLFYGLNGEIANMLHIQIADALQEKGIIPKHETETDGVEINPDSWLEQRGWVRIHGNNIQFAGCLNNKIGLPNINMTQKQIEVIRDYIMDCHQCEIKAGWRRERTSITMFTAMAMRDPLALNKKYFDYH